jgi:hypothetical protein
MQTALTKTLRKQRTALSVEPIHATAEPVKRYAEQIAELKGEPFYVVTIPNGSAAHGMGYRFVCIPETERAYYVSNGANIVSRAPHG